jgi:hypothetical protein
MDFPSYDLLDTPDPDESAVIVYVQTKDLRLQHLPVAGVTTLKLSELTRDGIAISNYGDYIFTLKRKPAVGWLGFVFGKNKTEAEKYTPWDVYERTEAYHWLPVVEQWQAAPNLTHALDLSDPSGQRLRRNR